MIGALFKQYDALCKEILSQKIILAWIMKECMAEYSEWSAEAIARDYIETEPQVSHISVDEEGGEWMPRIRGTNVEAVSSTEGKITYDIRFTAIVPETGRRIWIDVEPQKNFRPGYSLLKRGTYYLARMISSQRGREFRGSDYDDLKKAYTVWICMKPPKKWEHRIKFYEVQDRDKSMGTVFGTEDFDLMTQVVICLGDPDDPRAVGLLRLLSVLLTNVYSVDEKQRILESEFGIVLTDTIRKGMNSMCNLGEGIYEDGIERGMGILNQLYLTLISRGRFEDLERAAQDDEFRQSLMNEFGLSFRN